MKYNDEKMPDYLQQMMEQRSHYERRKKKRRGAQEQISGDYPEDRKQDRRQKVRREKDRPKQIWHQPLEKIICPACHQQVITISDTTPNACIHCGQVWSANSELE